MRRWIRKKELEADEIGGRIGYRINSDQLQDFLLRHKGWSSMAELTQNYLDRDNKSTENALSLSEISGLGLSEAIKKLLGSDDSFNSKEPNVELLSVKNQLFKKRNALIHSIGILQKELSKVEKEIMNLTELEE